MEDSIKALEGHEQRLSPGVQIGWRLVLGLDLRSNPLLQPRKCLACVWHLRHTNRFRSSRCLADTLAQLRRSVPPWHLKHAPSPSITDDRCGHHQSPTTHPRAPSRFVSPLSSPLFKRRQSSLPRRRGLPGIDKDIGLKPIDPITLTHTTHAHVPALTRLSPRPSWRHC